MFPLGQLKGGGGSRGGGHDIMQFLFSLPIIGLPLLLPDVLPYLLLDALQSHHWAHKIRVRHRNVYALANDRHNHPYRSKNWTNKLNRCWSHRNSPHFLLYLYRLGFGHYAALNWSD
ncbi:hypothetical protein GQX74_005213 [Glossina fuscipes]|nr:hypothetical protein GQX74_005213 [Glossina fuscipes]